MFLYQPFEELQSLNSEFKLITPKPMRGTYFDTKLSRFGLAGSARVAILEFSMFRSQQFEELHGQNFDFLLITPKYFYGTLFGTILAILDFSKRLYLSCLMSYKAEIQNLSYLPLNMLLGFFYTKLNIFGLVISPTE